MPGFLHPRTRSPRSSGATPARSSFSASRLASTSMSPASGEYGCSSMRPTPRGRDRPLFATSSISRFIKTYPTNADIDYAYYLKALINFDRENRWLAKIARLDTSARDLGAAQQSYNDFNDVVRRFPTSKYAEESRQRMIYLRNRLAQHDLTVGMYYYERDAYVSAVGRAKYVLETYPQSDFDDDAVALLAASYKKLGQDGLSQDARRVLESNYPEHPYLTGKWPTRRSRWNHLNPFAGEIEN